ncbi:hypothetical protein F0562_005744 [Nyssa sinensis]|uniref:U-box domain-containing protein n=1 Tax=Nyssa sinensis TaxID=561372 RepID=A0A5J5AJ13_9ASTE|nr:hypothetical protein F0562_005744 [Nyssa sinensis]
MVRDDLYITVPSFFKCPISLDVMKSPVSLCTGVTYDRSSIQRWLDSGNNTCPATMQVLQNKDLRPQPHPPTPHPDLDQLARVLEYIAIDAESKILIAEHSDVLSELFRLASSETDPNAIEAGLSCLICISMPKRIKVKIVQLGAVKKFGKMLSDSNLNVSGTEKILKLLEMASTCREGRLEMCEDAVCIPAIVKKVLKVSNEATDHAVMILWSLCYLFRHQKVQEAVTKSNGLTKILLLMQSNCSAAVRQMSSDLLKIFRVNSKSCLSCYETKTTHIMPF